MSKPPNFPEEFLDYAQSYMASALTLINQFGNESPFITFHNHNKSYILCSYFLMAHGVELYLKFLIKLLGKNPPNNTHNLKRLIDIVNPLLVKNLKKNLFDKEQMELIKSFDRYERFRYPADKNWNKIPEMFSEAETWSEDKIKIFFDKWNQLKDNLNSVGYDITLMINSGTKF